MSIVTGHINHGVLGDGKRRRKYRRCHAGIVRTTLPLSKDISDTNPSDGTFRNYKTEFADSIKELTDILYDVSGEDAKRILKNIWRWVEHKQKELKDE